MTDKSPLEPRLVAGSTSFVGKRISMVYGVPAQQSPSDCLFIAHEVKSSMNSRLVTYLHSRLAARGFLTVRFNFPYAEGLLRLFRRRDQTRILVGSYRKVMEKVQRSEWKPKNLFLGGISLGAAVASHVVADGPGAQDIRGLFFLAYPIHLRKKPEMLGEQHLDKITVPMLFVSGTRDVYADQPTLNSTVSRLSPRAQVHWIPGADHGFKRDRRIYGKVLDEIVEAVEKWVRSNNTSGP